MWQVVNPQAGVAVTRDQVAGAGVAGSGKAAEGVQGSGVGMRQVVVVLKCGKAGNPWQRQVFAGG